MTASVDAAPVVDTGQAIAAAAALLSCADDVTLLAHVRPDADALGSALALGRALQRRGARVVVSFGAPDTVPETLRPLDVHGLVVPPARVPAAPPVLVTRDVSEPARLGPLADRLGAAGATVVLDHHVSNPGFGDLRILDPCAEATAVLAHRLLRAMGEAPDRDMARCLYAGLVTDTRNFRDAGPGAHRLAAELIEAGADPHALVTPIMDTHPFPWFTVLADLLRGPSWTRPRRRGSAWSTRWSRPSTWRGSARRRSTAWSTPCGRRPRRRSRRWPSRPGRPAGRCRCARGGGWTWRRPRARSAAAGIPGPRA